MKKYIQPMSWQFNAIKYLLSAIVFIVPLYVSKSHLYPFTTPKSLVLIGGAIVLALLYLWNRAKEQESVFAFTWVHGALGIFISLLIISGFTGIVPHHAFFGDMTGMGIILVCSTAVVASILGYVIQKERSFITSLITCSLAASVAMGAILYGGEKLLPTSADGSTLGNTSYVGAYFLVNVCFALGLFIFQKRLWKRVAIAVAGLFIVTSPILFNKDIFKGIVSIKDIVSNPLLLSGSANGAVMGLGIAVLAIGALFLIRSQKKVLQWVGAIALIGLFLGIYIAGQQLIDPATSLHQSYAAEKSSNRFLFWEIASQAVSERPLLGFGMNSYSYVFQEHFSPLFFYPGYVPELWTENPHNMFREIEVDAGILGLVTYLLLIGTTGIVLFIASRSEDKTKKTISIVMFGALFGYVIQNLFVFDTVAPLLMFYLLVGYALGVSKYKTLTINSHYKTVKVVVASIVAIFLIYIFVVAVVKPWQESIAWASYTAKNKISKEDTPQTISLMGYTGDTAYLADKVLVMFQEGYSDEKTSPQIKQRYLDTFKIMISNLEEDIDRDGHDSFRAHWTIAQSYIAMIQITKQLDDETLDKAQKHLEQALAINPSSPLVYYDMVQLQAFRKDSSKVLAWSRAAITLSPEYRGGYLLALRLTKGGVTDKSFDQFAIAMKDRWCAAGSLCAKGK